MKKHLFTILATSAVMGVILAGVILSFTSPTTTQAKSVTTYTLSGKAFSDMPQSSNETQTTDYHYGGRGVGDIDMSRVTINPTVGEFGGSGTNALIGNANFSGVNVDKDCLANKTSSCDIKGYFIFTDSANNSQSGGWDGVVRMSDPSWSPTVKAGPEDEKGMRKMSGYAWGGDVVGWVDFSGVTITRITEGCRDEKATNYDPQANQEGDCTYDPPVIDVCLNLSGNQPTLPLGHNFDSNNNCIKDVCVMVGTGSWRGGESNKIYKWFGDTTQKKQVSGLPIKYKGGNIFYTPEELMNILNNAYSATTTYEDHTQGGEYLSVGIIKVEKILSSPDELATRSIQLDGFTVSLTDRSDAFSSVRFTPRIEKASPLPNSCNPVTCSDPIALNQGYNGACCYAPNKWNVEKSECRPPNPNPVCSLITNSTTIKKGSSATLTWSTQNAVSVSITNMNSPFALSDSRVVTPIATTTYELTAKGAVETVDCKSSVTITVESEIKGCMDKNARNYNPNATEPDNPSSCCFAPNIWNDTAKTCTVPPKPDPATCSLTATNKTITEGQSTTISWDIKNGKSITLTPNGFASITLLSGNAKGNIPVTPTTTTTYKISVTGQSGTTPNPCTDQVTITVVDPPCEPPKKINPKTGKCESSGFINPIPQEV